MLLRWVSSKDLHQLVEELGEGFHFLYYTPEYDPESIVREMGDREFVGCSSFQGVFTPKGFESPIVAAITVPPEVAEIKAVGVKFEGDPSDSVRAALEEFSRPEVVWLHASPGSEERVLEGITGAFGPVPVLGGSAADNDLSGRWSVVAPSFWAGNGAVMALVYPKVKVGVSFWGGYMPVGPWGTITKAEGRRIYEIDGKPAAEVYNQWTEGLISEFLGKEASVLALTTMEPLGVEVGDKLRSVILAHPERVYPDGSLGVFVEVKEGQKIGRMKVSERGLTTRPVELIKRAKRNGKIERVFGGVMVYCAGCINAVILKANEVAKAASEAAGAPVLGPATFGEQGIFVKPEPRHGNLMSSALLFGE